MSAASLSPLYCTGCGAHLPLATPAPCVACPHCGGANDLPADYVAAAAARHQAAEARRQAEPLWQRLSGGAPSWCGWVAVTLIVLLPPLVTLVGLLVPTPSLNTAEVTGLYTLPALLPGTGLWIWSGAVSATTLRFRAALAARPASKGDGPPECRNCGAPLAAEPGALAATCGYCGADSLLEQIPIKAISERLREAVTSLQQGTALLRSRRAMLGLGVGGVALLVGGSSMMLWIVLRYVS